MWNISIPDLPDSDVVGETLREELVAILSMADHADDDR